MKKYLLLLLIPSLAFASEWQCISRIIECNTWRMETPAGWVVSGENTASGQHGYAMTFVPDPNKEWKV